MRRVTALAAFVAFMPVVCLAQSFPGLHGLLGDDVAAKVTTRQGQVSVLKDNVLWAIDAGDSVRTQQVVVTGPDGYAQFHVADGSSFEVFPNSQVTFRSNPGSLKDLLDVWLGRIRVHIQRPGGQPNPNRVFTPTAIISVRGTIFDVTVDDEEETTVVLVEEGSVGVEHRMMPRDGGPKILGPGEELTVHRNLPLSMAKRFDTGAFLMRAADIFVQIMVRMPRLPGGVGGPGPGTSGPPLPGDTGATPPPPPPPPPPGGHK